MGHWVSRRGPDCQGNGRNRSPLRAFLLLGLLGLLAACGVPPRPGAEILPEIFVSTSADAQSTDDATLKQLDGSEVSGSVYVYVQAHAGIAQVRFFLDGQQQPYRTVTESPFGATLDTTSLQNGEHTLTAEVSVGQGAGQPEATATFRVQNDAAAPGAPAPDEPRDLPAPWLHTDVGQPAAAGTVAYDSDSFNVEAAGGDIWNEEDTFHFVYQALSGNGEIVAQVANLETDVDWAKAGVMIRESLEPGSSHVMANLAAGNGAMMTWRNGTGSASESSSGSQNTAQQQAAAPQWLKLVRSGDTIAGFYSTDGQNWESIGSRSVPMAEQVYVGLALSSHDAGSMATASFADVEIATGATEPAPEPTPAPLPEPVVDNPMVPAPPAAPTEADYFVATNGSDDNDGRSVDTPFRTIGKAASIVEPGDVVFIRGGHYTEGHIEFERSGTKDAPITFMSYPGEWAVLDFSSYTPGEDSYRVWLNGANWNVFRNFEIYKSPQQGIFVRYNASDNVFYNIVIDGSWGSGYQIWEGSRNRVYYSVARDSWGGGDADGFGSIGQGGPSYDNAYYYCISDHNSDDGFDTWQGQRTVLVGNVSYDNGYNGGNGNGFKLGRGFPPEGVWTAPEDQWYRADGRIFNNIAYSNSANGFDNNTGYGNLFVNNTAWDNGNDNFYSSDPGGNPTPYDGDGVNTWINNLSVDGSVEMNSTVESHNSWNVGISDAQVVSVEPGSADFLALSSASPAIDRGTVDRGVSMDLPYVGQAPDLGALEYGQSIAAWLEPTLRALDLADAATSPSAASANP